MKYQIADVSRLFKGVSQICDAGGRAWVSIVAFGRKGRGRGATSEDVRMEKTQ